MSAWTPAIEAELTRYWNFGYVTSKIANIINGKYKTHFSRNAVLGKAHRLKLGTHPDRAALTAPAKHRDAPEPTRTILRECQWPIGDPGTPEFHFCGDGAVIGKPYCVKHCEAAYKRKDDDDQAY